MLAAMACLFAVPALGQSPENAAHSAAVQLGPLKLSPTLTLTNFGVDTNVFNAASASHPQSDFTTTLTPGANLWFHAGRSLLTASVKEDLVYYREFASERSVNGYYTATAVVPLNRVSFKGGVDFFSARDRPGFEIDTRSQHTELEPHAGVEVRAFGKTFVDASVHRATVRFDRDAEFMGANLNHELSRVMTSEVLSVRHQLTPVTAMTFDVVHEDDAFLYSDARDSASTRLMAGVRFGTRLGGSAAVGYRQFEPRAADVPAFRGLIANADVSFATVGSTRLGVQVVRDLNYSYDVQQPYYIQSGATVSLTRGLFGPLNGTARVGLQQLAYRGRAGAALLVPDRADFVSLFGGSVGYRVAGGMRVSINVDRQQRNSDLAGYSYGGLRYGTSVTYGF